MSLEYEVVIETQQYAVDMKSGLDTLTGVSDGARCIVQTILERKVPIRKTPQAPVRTIMKRTFEGSYGLKFSIEIFDDILKAKLRTIGQTVLAELISYYLNESIYIDLTNLSEKAQETIKSLGNISQELIDRLRITAVKNIHAVTKNFGYDVKVQQRSSSGIKLLVEFNEESASTLDLERSTEEIEIQAAITRFNTKTGNGRLQIKGANETVAFGFSTDYQIVSLVGKKKFSINLNENNGLRPEHHIHIKIKVSPIRLHSQKIIKYIVEGNVD